MDGEDGAHTHAESADGEHLVVLVVVALAHRRLGPSSSATISTVNRALSSPAVYAAAGVGRRPLGCLAQSTWEMICPLA